MAIQILDVGQCGFDGPRMMRLFQERLGATVTNAADADEAAEKLEEDEFDLVLVNRVFASDDGDGIALIRELRKAGVETPMMLVSDLPEAQEQAVAAGAVRGFGKSKLADPATLELIKKTAAGT